MEGRAGQPCMSRRPPFAGPSVVFLSQLGRVRGTAQAGERGRLEAAPPNPHLESAGFRGPSLEAGSLDPPPGVGPIRTRQGRADRDFMTLLSWLGDRPHILGTGTERRPGIRGLGKRCKD